MPRAEPVPSLSDPVYGDPVYGDPVTGDPVTGDPVLKAVPQNAARPPTAKTSEPEQNVGVITKVVHETIDDFGSTAADLDLREEVKCRLASLHIAYDSTVVAKAIDSARVQRSLR